MSSAPNTQDLPALCHTPTLIQEPGKIKRSNIGIRKGIKILKLRAQ